MTSAAPPKRMVSSVFITLASPYRATVTPTPQITQHSAVPVSPTAAHRKPSTSSGSALESGHTVSPAEARPSPLEIRKTHDSKPNPAHALFRAGKREETHTDEFFPPPPPPPASLDLGVSETLPPPPPTCPLTDPKPPAPTREVCVERAPPADQSQNEPSAGAPTEEGITPDVCGFCRKPVALSEPAIEALNRTYHSSCFQCRQCHAALAGKTYFNKAGIPLCEDCYQASLEPCWACGEVIKDHVIRALERAYHPPCFVCTTCKQPIGEQRFAQGEVGEVYCLQDYYRKYAPQCSVCGELIIPREDGTDSYTVECLGRSFHEDCYRCELCAVLLSPEPNEHGCHPLDGQILCKPCHLSLIQTSQH
ncbi:filamin-binding LIM protein 1 [Neoarius graeffei]|uniref:filamin-binding LIM protein 1 n=1 Tax=Neoarius graeffei TaxID=443677 RepID=UPI00298C2080|nr:filamin-binding LIM protein 1 [Neoarius graeffei]XP_060766321.1 filamin-binding LIM protein 1 [Neoarius graeffei]